MHSLQLFIFFLEAFSFAQMLIPKYLLFNEAELKVNWNKHSHLGGLFTNLETSSLVHSEQ